MDKWTACEEAYKNGYEQGKKDAVGHAHWEMKEIAVRTPFGRNAFCSACGYEPIELGRYCPNCGFMMDGEENG